MTDLRSVVAQAIADLDAEHYAANYEQGDFCDACLYPWPCVTRQVADDLRAVLGEGA